MRRTPILNAAVAVLQVAAVYTYFLLFDQFGFLQHLHNSGLTPYQVQLVMMIMGAGGLIASFASARWVSPGRMRGFLALAWIACAAVALIAPMFGTMIPLAAEGLMIGATTGVITVLVASVIRELLPRENLGFCIGAGTAVAYAVANTPALFDGSLLWIAVLSAVLSLLSAWFVWVYLPLCMAESGSAPSGKKRVKWTWVLGLAVLVCLDSGAFAMIQQDPVLKSWTWGPADHKFWLAIVHACAALAAGLLIDRGFRFSLILTTWVLFALAFSIIPGGMPDAFPSALIYACGISLYSVVLVAAPSLHGGRMESRARWAAWLFGISGWVGSAFGIGMAQHHKWVPDWFLLLTALLLVVALLKLRPVVLTNFRRVFGPAVVVIMMLGLWLAVAHEGTVTASPFKREAYGDENIYLGAQVYRKEGCINCHSQYIRPGSRDESIWGPYSPVNRNETPPFVGNRRQGPDLKNIGLRRSAEWHRIHLQNPRAVFPDSRMPSYAHLFADGKPDGEHLIAYLLSRGEGRREPYRELTLAWQPKDLTAGSAEHGEALFQKHCAVCHGSDGRGDGPTARLMDPPPRNLHHSAFALSNPSEPDDPLSVTLSRIIKFGLEGTSMPGHEILTENDISDIVQYVASLGVGEEQASVP